MKKVFLTASAIGLILTSQHARAEDSINTRIDALEQEIQELKHEQAAKDKKAAENEKEIQLLKRQQKVSEEKTTVASENTAAVSDKQANVEIGRHGLAISSPDKKYELDIHGVFQFDDRAFLNDKYDTGHNDTLIRRARPILTFKAGDTLLYFMPDFAGTTTAPNNTKIYDAYAEYSFNEAANVRVGKFKPPVSLEELQADTDLFFTERGYAAELAPTRDIGAQLAGNLYNDKFEYQVGIFDGTTDFGNADADSDEKKDFDGRVFLKPFKDSNLITLQGFGIGVGGTIGDHHGNTANPIISTTTPYVTPGQEAFIHLNTGTFSDGQQWRVAPQAYLYSGSFGMLAEYAISDQHIAIGTKKGELDNTAWQLTGGYILTGEESHFSGGVKPTQDFNVTNGTWGAWELVGRVGQINIDTAAFPTFASITTSAKQATTYGAGVNWYLNENLKIDVDYNYTNFDGGAVSGDRPEEHAILSRVQLRF